MKNAILILMMILPTMVVSSEKFTHSIKFNNGKIINLREIKEALFVPSLQNITTTDNEIYYSEEILSIILKTPNNELTLPATEFLKEKILIPKLKSIGGDGSGGG